MTNSKTARLANIYWVGVAVLLVIAGVAFSNALTELIDRWNTEEEYGHGFLLPLVSVYFLWLAIPRMAREDWLPRWQGPAIALLALLVFLVGEISALYILAHYALVLFLFGVGVSIVGMRPARHIVLPLAVLLFAIPIPYYIQAGLSGNLQLVSSWIGVKFIAAFGIPVYLEGNVIDLGVYKLQVVDACSGLRYLFPLMSFGFICAYLFHVALWKRVLVFLSSVPITILMNSVRIGVIGLLVELYGIDMAEGFMHDFEGWSIFGVCLVILFAEMWLLARLGSDAQPFRSAFGLDAPQGIRGLLRPERIAPLGACLLLLLAALVVSLTMSGRAEIVPPRKPLVLFPQHLSQWQGVTTALEANVLAKLKLNDYVLADYTEAGALGQVNFYVAWYDSQRSGASPHSPKVCIPGGGWEIVSIERRELPFTMRDEPLRFNRVIIQHGQQRQVVYYWFQQRGRAIANEFVMKWYLFRDALLDRRSDGALVRLITPVIPGEAAGAADDRLTRFAYDVIPELPAYVPN